MVTAVILAGGRSTRFGSDKLAPHTGLLPTLVGAILPHFVVILVGPARPLDLGTITTGSGQASPGDGEPDLGDGAAMAARLTWVDDDEPGGGPAAGALTGLRVALSQQPDEPVLLLPGDAPGGWAAARGLIAALSFVRHTPGSTEAAPQGDTQADTQDETEGDRRDHSTRPKAACALLREGGTERLLPLPCALSPDGARELLAGGSGAGRSLRSLLAPLHPVGVELPSEALFDVDTPADLQRWRDQFRP